VLQKFNGALVLLDGKKDGPANTGNDQQEDEIPF